MIENVALALAENLSHLLVSSIVFLPFYVGYMQWGFHPHPEIRM